MIVSTWVVPLPVRAAIADQPYWLQIVEIIVIADLGIYFVHRMFHSIPLLWRFHQIHHSSEELDWLAAYRVHPVEQIAFRGISLAPIFALGFSDAAIAVSQYLTNGNRFSSIPISASALGHCVGLSHRHNSITGITARTSTRATRISQRNSRCWISCPARPIYLAMPYRPNMESMKPCLRHTSPSCFTRLKAWSDARWLQAGADARWCAGRHQQRQ